MAARLSRWSDPNHEPGPDDIEARFAGAGLTPHTWSNGPDYRYAAHDHTYRKVLYCLRGSIVFHTPDGDFALQPGDRLDLDSRTVHSATVGPDGVTCMEAPAG